MPLSRTTGRYDGDRLLVVMRPNGRPVRRQLEHLDLSGAAVDLDEGARRQQFGGPLDVHHTRETEFTSHHRGM